MIKVDLFQFLLLLAITKFVTYYDKLPSIFVNNKSILDVKKYVTSGNNIKLSYK